MDVNVGNKSGGKKQNDNGARERKPNDRNRPRILKYDNYIELNNSIKNIYLATQGTE